MTSESVDTATLPPLIANEFQNINRYWDVSLEQFVAKITPGQYYVSGAGETVVTVLGSCISACVRDPVTGIGGMNHFMLPRDLGRDEWGNRILSSGTRYGNVAMERLINVILKNGGKRERLECKLFGGARVLNLDSDIGQQNITFINEYVRIEGVKVEACDLGGPYPRKVIYFPATGRVRVKKLQSMNEAVLQMRERAYIKRLEQSPIAAEVTLF